MKQFQQISLSLLENLAQLTRAPLSIRTQQIFLWANQMPSEILACSLTHRNIQNNACCCSVDKQCPTFCEPMDCSMPGFPVLHYLPKFAQTHVHCVNDAIQPSHSLFPPSPHALNHSASQSFPMNQFFTSGGQNIEVSASVSVLPMTIQD